MECATWCCITGDLQSSLCCTSWQCRTNPPLKLLLRLRSPATIRRARCHDDVHASSAQAPPSHHSTAPLLPLTHLHHPSASEAPPFPFPPKTLKHFSFSPLASIRAPLSISL